jgi:hypothetical protein
MKEIIYSVGHKFCSSKDKDAVFEYGKVILKEDIIVITNRAGDELGLEYNQLEYLIVALQNVYKGIGGLLCDKRIAGTM